MVIPVQKHQRSFSENEKDGVGKLDQFGSNKKKDPISIFAFREVPDFTVGS
jgi:hypothetical protein